MAPRFTTIHPSLPVSSIPEAVEYYTSRLGFRLAGRDGDNHCWVQLVDDDSVSKWDVSVNIYLRRV
jgi:catechol 2,3-dioxygenase-like lactoylglutathione lyase family enzyme